MVFSRKRKDNRSPSFILDDSPKRTKVQAQRKFAAGSNVNSPVLTPVKELERQEKMIPEPIELIPMKRPNTEDFLTFLCFRGTPVLPTTLNFFNNASMIDTRTQTNESPTTSPKNGVIIPSTISKAQGDRPFIAFGVRKRADPIVVSRHMDKKRRHALALQALRRKYQEQKMAKIRAITISKLSEKVQTNKTVVRTTRSITKSAVTKKNISQKTKITVVATKRVKVTTRRTSTLKTLKQLKQPIRPNKKKQKMCLRSFRGRFVQRELLNKPVKKRPISIPLKKTNKSQNEEVEVEEEEEEVHDNEETVEEEEEEFSSDDDEPLLKKVDGKTKGQKIARKTASGNKKTSEIRLTRSNMLNQIKSRRAANKRLLARAQSTLKSPPTSPRLRARLQKRKILKKPEVTVPIKKKIITKKVEIKTRTTLNNVDQVKRIEKKDVTQIVRRELRKPVLNKSKEGESSKSIKKEELKKSTNDKNKDSESQKSAKKEEDLKKSINNKNKESELTRSSKKEEDNRKSINSKNKEVEVSKNSKDIKKRLDKPPEETIKKKDVIRSEDKAETRRSLKKIEEDKLAKASTNKDKRGINKQEETKLTLNKEKKSLQKQDEEIKIIVEDKRNTRESLKKQALEIEKNKKPMKREIKVQKIVEKKASVKIAEEKLNVKKIKVAEKKIEEPVPEKKNTVEKKKVDEKKIVVEQKTQKKNIKIAENEAKVVKNEDQSKSKTETTKDTKIEDKIQKTDKKITKQMKLTNQEKKSEIKQQKAVTMDVKQSNKQNVDKNCEIIDIETKSISSTLKQIEDQKEVFESITIEKKLSPKLNEVPKKSLSLKHNSKLENELKANENLKETVNDKFNPKNLEINELEVKDNAKLITNTSKLATSSAIKFDVPDTTKLDVPNAIQLNITNTKKLDSPSMIKVDVNATKLQVPNSTNLNVPNILKLDVPHTTSLKPVIQIDNVESTNKEFDPIIKSKGIKIYEIGEIKLRDKSVEVANLKQSVVLITKPKEFSNLKKMYNQISNLKVNAQNNDEATVLLEKPSESKHKLVTQQKCPPLIEIKPLKNMKKVLLLPEKKEEIPVESKVLLIKEDTIKIMNVEEDKNEVSLVVKADETKPLVVIGATCKNSLTIKDNRKIISFQENDKIIVKAEQCNVKLNEKKEDEITEKKVLMNQPVLIKNEITKPEVKVVANEVVNVANKIEISVPNKKLETIIVEKNPIELLETNICKSIKEIDVVEKVKEEKRAENSNKCETAVKKSKCKTDKLNPKTNEATKKTVPEKKDTVVVDDASISKRPSRKTKEAAAIYMEILGHKLGNDEDIDDISIDSFPELPNVRKTEQREIELKAKANIKPTTPVIPKNSEADPIEEPTKKRKSKTKSIESSDSENVQKPKRNSTEPKKLRKSKLSRGDESDESFTMEIKMPPEKLSRQTRNRSPKLYKSFSDTDSESDFIPLKKPPKRKSENLTDSEQKPKMDVPKKIVQKKADVDSFSESDEEPLVKLTQKKEAVKIKKKPDEIIVGKQKRECTKRPQNYLTLFSSSDEEDKYFHGFVKCEEPPKPKIIKSEPTIDLLFTKDVGRRYGKEKVNMSNEQIEKWLNDSALAGMSVIKKENDEMLKFGEKIPTETSLDTNNPIINTETLKESLLKIDIKDDKKDESLSSTPEKSTSPSKPQSNERKTIFRKEKTEPLKNVNAFSVCNESSVYAFEADNEDSISTPFRRPSRRPSSTATSRSEDDLSRLDPEFIRAGKFRLPNLVRHDSNPKLKELTDDSNNSSSQVIDHDSEIHQQVTENEHLFYIPKGVAMKGTGTHQQKKLSPAKQEKPASTVTAMYPPSHISMQKNKPDTKYNLKLSCNRNSDRLSETSEEFKYKIPSSPSASSSSSAKLYKRQTKSKVKIESYPSVNVTEFPNLLSNAQIVEAPVFHPNEKEFSDPLEYIEKIRVKAEKFGICRIVPPANFKPECKVLDEMRFTAYNQYVHKMMHRWGPNFRELVAIRKYLATQSISLKHPPWIGGMEIDLPRLYQTVQTLGGLKEVIEKKKWPRVSELMKIPKSAQDRVTKLDDIYCKYLLPYDTLSPDERDKLFDSVETEWAKRESKNLMKAQHSADDDKLEIDDNESEDEEESDTECIVKGRSMALSAFYRIARNTMSMWFKTSEPTAMEVEDEFWKHVTTKQFHLCVHSGSIDSGNWGYGFAVSKNSPFARHAWNLKVLTNNSGSILRSMGPVMGLTVPTLHVGMVFSGCCWYRDPHSLPWIEYLHTGGNKIWYGIPDSMSEKFHSTLLKLVPNYCLNKSIWLPSDTVMLPPNILVDNGVSLTRTVQEPGEFVVIFPKAFTSNICTGYTVSESVFFASSDWLKTAENIFEEMRNSCEPSMFSYEKLLLNIVSDPRSDIEVLKQIIPAVQVLCDRERKDRDKLKALGVVNEEKLPLPDVRKKKKMHEVEIEYICEDCRWNLFCSMVFEIQENAVYCIDHAIERIKEKELEPANCKLMFTYDSAELTVLVDKLKATIEMKIQKKAGSKFTGLATLMNR